MDNHRRLTLSGIFSLKATHAGYQLYALRTTRFNYAGEGIPGLSMILAKPGISYEEWVARGGEDKHLNWDLNRGVVLAVGRGEDLPTKALLKVGKALRK